MTAAEFSAWLARRGLSHTEAAPLLAAKQPEVHRWATGVRRVPPRVARIVELLDTLAAERPCG